MKLMIEHKCLNWKNRRFGSGPPMYSEYKIRWEELIMDEFDLQRNIELSSLYVNYSMPDLYIRKLILLSRR